MIEDLMQIGLNKLEAGVYLQLLSHPPATAYKVGKLLNKPTANVYKAMDALAEKGAVMIEDNKTKLCKAVPPEEFIGAFQKHLWEKSEKLKNNLQSLQSQEPDQSSYSIRSVALVFEKAINMLKEARKIVVVDAFPETLKKIAPLLTETAKRGVKVYVEAYQPIEIPHTHLITSEIGEKALEHWQSQQLNIMVDGESHLIALLDNSLNKVKQATYSQNIYMSCLLLAGALKEQAIMQLLAITGEDNFETKAKNILEQVRFFYNTDIPGFDKLMKL